METENNFLGPLCKFRVEVYFPLKRPFINHLQNFIDLFGRKVCFELWQAKLLIKTKTNRPTKIDTCRTSATTSAHFKLCPIRVTLCLSHFNYSRNYSSVSKQIYKDNLIWLTGEHLWLDYFRFFFESCRPHWFLWIRFLINFLNI